MMIPDIDVTQVPVASRKHPNFIEALEALQYFLTLPKEIKAFCTHEAAHVIYFLHAGVTTHSINGPRVVPNPDGADLFDAQPAWIETENPKLDPRNINENQLRALARAFASGGVAAIVLEHAKKGGDANDETNFIKMCTEGGLFESDIRLRWQRAKTEVRKELIKDRNLVRQIQLKGKEIKAAIFPTEQLQKSLL